MHEITWSREALHNTGASRSPLKRWFSRRQHDNRDEQRATNLASAFIAAACNLGLARDTTSCAGIPGTATPIVRHVRLGQDCDRLMVETMPGQLVDDYEAVAPKLARALGGARCYIQERSHQYVSIDVYYVDPLSTQVTTSVCPEIVLGSIENGQLMTWDLASDAHMIVQGQTRSGKSRFLYGVLTQVVERRDAVVGGVDPTGLLLRPFKGTKHEDIQALGSHNIQAHRDTLKHLVAIMDERIAKIPDDDDKFPCTEADPYIVVVLEELPGLLRLAGDVDGKKNGPLATDIKAQFGRLLAESAKAGFRLVIISQRADADIIGGFERDQAPITVSFPVRSASAVTMLHPACPDDQAKEHLTALPSYALISRPGIAVARMRSPEMGDYRTYRDAIAQHRSEPAE